MNLTPTPKVAAGVLAGSITTIIVWGMSQYAHVSLPAEVASALTVLITFGASWITSDRK